MHHEVLCLEQLPELFEHLGGELRRDAAQIGQLLGQPLHIAFGQSAQNLLGQLLAHCDQQDRRLAHPVQIAPTARCRVVRAPVPALPRSFPFVLRLAVEALVGVNPALQQSRALRRLPLQMTCHLLEDLLRPGALRIRALPAPAASDAADARRSSGARSFALGTWPRCRSRPALAQRRPHPEGQHDQQPQPAARHTFTSTGEFSAASNARAEERPCDWTRFSSNARSSTVSMSPRAVSNPTAAWASAVRLRSSSADRGCHTAGLPLAADCDQAVVHHDGRRQPAHTSRIFHHVAHGL